MELEDINVDDFRRTESLLSTEMDQIQMLAWDFYSSYKMGDIDRSIRIFHIILDIVEAKPQLPTLQTFFKGAKLGRFKDHIDLNNAAKYIAAIQEEVKKLADWRVKPTPIK